MSTHLGNYIRSRRENLGLRRSQVARLLGYENVSKGSARLHDLEQGRKTNQGFLVRLMGVLQIEPQVIQDLIDRDRQEYVDAWNKLADEPIPMHAAIRLIPGFIVGIDLPQGITSSEQAVAWAVETAIRRRLKVFIVVSRRLSFTVHEDGRVDDIHATPDSNALPWSALGSTRFLVNLGGGSKPTESEARDAL